MKLLRTTYCLVAVLILAAMTTVPAWADSQSWYFNGTNSPSDLPCSAGSPCGEVTLNVSGSNATFTVTSLLNGYVFDSFGFNTISGVSVSLVAGSGTGELGAGYNLGGSGNEDGWGSFKYNFDTGLSGGSKGSDCHVVGGVPGSGCTFTFTVKCAGSCTLSLADFEKSSSGGNGSGYFAGHMASSRKSGYAGNPVPIPVNEPATLSVMGAGLLSAAGVLRRRFRGMLR